MRTFLKNTHLYCLILLLAITNGIQSQVGIGTETPEGALDLNSQNLPSGNYYGLVLPRVALTNSTSAAPIVNANNPADPLAIGTVVYNTNTTTTGTNDVSPGIYMWDGVDWINEFPKKDAAIFKQDIPSSLSTAFRTTSTGDYATVPGLLNQSFTPKYSGRYKIELSVNYGGGYVQDLAGGNTNPLSQKANFKLTFNGNEYIVPISAHSTYGSTQYYLIWEQATSAVYENLVAGTPYIFTVEVDQLDSPGFINDGNGGDGRGWVGLDIPCSVEFVYVD